MMMFDFPSHMLSLVAICGGVEGVGQEQGEKHLEEGWHQQRFLHNPADGREEPKGDP